MPTKSNPAKKAKALENCSTLPNICLLYTSNVILLEKDLMVLEQGIIEGRKTYANMIKYIKMTEMCIRDRLLIVALVGCYLTN